MTYIKSRHAVITACLVIIALTLGSGMCFGQSAADGPSSGSVYTHWKTVGQFAADLCLEMLQNAGFAPDKKDLIVLTNAGYSEMFGMPTQGALDGLTAVTGASRGKNTLVEIHAAAWDPLWVAVHDPASGAPAHVIRAFEFHDHYCPGVVSGILMAGYVQAHFPPGRSGYVVHGVDPWCMDWAGPGTDPLEKMGLTVQ